MTVELNDAVATSIRVKLAQRLLREDGRRAVSLDEIEDDNPAISELVNRVLASALVDFN